MALTQINPALFAGSSNTTAVIQSNGTTAITVDSSQNVGIGTTSPLRKFHVKGSGNTSQFESTSSSGYVYIGDSASSAIDNQGIGTVGNNLSFLAGGSERMRIDSSGNLKLTNSNNIASITQTAISLTGGTAGSPFVNGQSVNVITANSTTRGILIVGSTQNCSAIFFINASAAVNLSSQTTNETRFSITSGSSNTVNVFVSGSNIVLQNNIQASRDFYVTYIGQI
jgi:hypothetical protein